MDGSTGIGGFLLLAGDIAFRFVPATIAALTGTAPDTGTPSPVTTPITQPITPQDITYFLSANARPGAYEDLFGVWGVIVVLSVMVSLLLAAGAIYCITRIFQVRAAEEARYRAAAHPVAARDISKAQLRWNRIKEEISSENEQSWRLAILEADIMLNDLLDLQAYKGETMADKMKQVERADWRTIDMAWEAHRMRNTIAHQGSMLHLEGREARRIIGLYEQVFKEFKFVE